MAVVTSRGRASGIEPVELDDGAAAVAGLYERNAGRVFGYCLSRLGRREDAEDAVQTTFLHAIGGLRRGVVPLVESAWLLGIARNVCLARREAFGRRKRLESVCDPHVLADAAPGRPAPPEELVGLQEALAELPERQRRAVLLRDWRGLSYDEIAGELDVSVPAVETLIFRGRDSLARLLGDEPRRIGKRLAELGNLGSLLGAIKTAFTGGAAAVKVAAAVIAISSAGLAVGSLPPAAGGAGRPEAAPAAAASAPPARAVRQGATPPDAATLQPAASAGSRARFGPGAGGASVRPAGAGQRRADATAAGTAAAVPDVAAAAAGASPASSSTAAPAPGSASAAATGPVEVVTPVAKKVAGAAQEPVAALPVRPPVAEVPQAPAVPAVSPPALPALPAPVPAPPVSAPPVSAPPAPALPAPPPALPPPPVAVAPPALPAPPPVAPPPAVPTLPAPVPPPPPPVPPVLP